MQEASDFLHTYSLSSKEWFDRGIKNTSPRKTEQVTAFKVLGFPKTKVEDVQKIWKTDQVDFEIDPRVEEHIAVECQYAHYTKQ